MTAWLAQLVYWTFQAINTLGALGMTVNPRKTHESLMAEPQTTYRRLGMSPTVVELIHNVIRGHGTALLAISLFLYYEGPHSASSFLLITLTCLLSMVAHFGTLLHHTRSTEVLSAMGTIMPLWHMIGLNAIIALFSLIVFINFN
jgi:hypothetical protein